MGPQLNGYIDPYHQKKDGRVAHFAVILDGIDPVSKIPMRFGCLLRLDDLVDELLEVEKREIQPTFISWESLRAPPFIAKH